MRTGLPSSTTPDTLQTLTLRSRDLPGGEVEPAPGSGRSPDEPLRLETPGQHAPVGSLSVLPLSVSTLNDEADGNAGHTPHVTLHVRDPARFSALDAALKTEISDYLSAGDLHTLSKVSRADRAAMMRSPAFRDLKRAVDAWESFSPSRVAVLKLGCLRILAADGPRAVPIKLASLGLSAMSFIGVGIAGNTPTHRPDAHGSVAANEAWWVPTISVAGAAVAASIIVGLVHGPVSRRAAVARDAAEMDMLRQDLRADHMLDAALTTYLAQRASEQANRAARRLGEATQEPEAAMDATDAALTPVEDATPVDG